MTAPPPDEREARAAWQGVSAAFSALGRVFLCVDAGWRILHASRGLDDLLGPGAAAGVEGTPIEDLLGRDLFGPAGGLRAAIATGERREGWRGHLRRGGGEPHLVSITVAPFSPAIDPTCDPRVRSIVVLRPARTRAWRWREPRRRSADSWPDPRDAAGVRA
ncbi:MAG: hypothetical protein R2752_05325 [Vicinamibacterales bacterium]